MDPSFCFPAQILFGEDSIRLDDPDDVTDGFGFDLCARDAPVQRVGMGEGETNRGSARTRRSSASPGRQGVGAFANPARGAPITRPCPEAPVADATPSLSIVIMAYNEAGSIATLSLAASPPETTVSGTR